tara:strand:- start:550 stop:1038 length:489 start_codon:yes stop_codon:yes gene_type:complete
MKKCGIIGDMTLLEKDEYVEFMKILNYLIDKSYTFCIDNNENLNLEINENNFTKLSGQNFKELDIILFLNGDINFLNKIFNILILNLDIKLYLFSYKYWKSLEGWFEFNNIEFIKNEYLIIDSFDNLKKKFEVNKFENQLNTLVNNLSDIEEEVEDSSLESD